MKRKPSPHYLWFVCLLLLGACYFADPELFIMDLKRGEYYLLHPSGQSLKWVAYPGAYLAAQRLLITFNITSRKTRKKLKDLSLPGFVLLLIICNSSSIKNLLYTIADHPALANIAHTIRESGLAHYLPFI